MLIANIWEDTGKYFFILEKIAFHTAGMQQGQQLLIDKNGIGGGNIGIGGGSIGIGGNNGKSGVNAQH